MNIRCERKTILNMLEFDRCVFNKVDLTLWLKKKLKPSFLA